jgi:hypothetical protein
LADFTRGPRQPEPGTLSTQWGKFKDNLFAYTPSARFIAGGRTIISINKVSAPRLSSISWRILTEQRPIREIDNHFAYELAPNIIDVSGAYTEYREPFRGPTISQHQANPLSFMWHPYISIEVRDSLTDALLFFSGKCAITERSESVSMDGLMMTSIKWQALAWKDEYEPTIPLDNTGGNGFQQKGQTPIANLLDGTFGQFGKGVATPNASGKIGATLGKFF